MAVTGRTQFADLRSLIQVTEINRRNCVINVTERGKVGRIYIYDGRVYSAEADGQRGEEAFYQLFTWYESNFELDLVEEEPEREIETNNFTLLLRAAQFAQEPSEMTGKAAWTISGTLDVLSPFEIFQLFELNHNPARARISSEKGDRATVVFRVGRAVHAVCEPLEAEEAVYKTLTWNKGQFIIEYFTGKIDETITETIPFLITEAARRIDEQRLRAEREAKKAAELAQKTLRELEQGKLTPEQRVALAKRYLPLGSTAPVESILKLLNDPDIRVREQAIETIKKLPDPVVKGILFDPEASDTLLYHLGPRFADDEELCEAMLRNPNISDVTIARIAVRASAPVLRLMKELLGERVSSSPHIMAAISRNERTGPRETEPEKAEKQESEERKKKGTLQSHLKDLSLADKLFLAMKGTPTQRMVLVRNPEKRVALAVLDSPQITAGEVETIAKMKSVNPEVLAEIASRTEWSNQYPIAKALVMNPKTPPAAAVPLVRKLRDCDLRPILRDRNLHETIRAAARKRMRVLEQKRKL